MICSPKGLIKYNKTNGTTPMKTHVETTHPKLWTQRKQICSEKVVTLDHTQEPRKKRASPSSYIITTFFSAKNPYTKTYDVQL
jgi:hypothetical protein